MQTKQENQDIEQVIARCKQGEQRAFEELVEKYSKRCFGYFYRLTGNVEVSNDLLSELFLKLVSKISYYRGGSFEFWLFKIAANIYYDYLRGQQRERALLERHTEHLMESTTEQSEPYLADKLQKHLGQLDPDTRELVMMRFYSQLSFKEIAEIKREPVGTVLSKVHRGLARLRQAMEKYNEQPK